MTFTANLITLKKNKAANEQQLNWELFLFCFYFLFWNNVEQ